MKNDLSKSIEIPSNIKINLVGNQLIVNGPEGENKKDLKLLKVNIEKKDNLIILSYKNATKKEKKIINTTSAHIKNLFLGVQKKFEYKLKICSSHFPMNVKMEGREVIIKNFLGEKAERRTKVPEGVEVKIE